MEEEKPGMQAGDEKRQQALEVLSMPDAIMETDVLQTVNEFAQAGGNITHALQRVTDSYIGYAHMARLVCQWLEETPATEGSDEAPTSSSSVNEATFLRAFIKDRFDPALFYGVFNKGAPLWLDGIIHSPPGRQLLYELSSKHKNCLLLNFAIQKMLGKGYEDEVARVGSSLSGYFGVFHRLLVRRLRDLSTLSGTDSAALEQLSTDVVQSVCPSQHTYVHAQLLLQSLGARPWGGRFRRLSQEVEAQAAQQQGVVVWRMHHCFVPGLHGQEAHVQAARLVSKLLARTGSHDSLRSLASLYQSDNPPPLDLLRHPNLLQQLVAEVFDPSKPMQQAETRGAVMRLLSIAAAAVDERAHGGSVDTRDVAATEAALNTAAAYVQDICNGIKMRPDQHAAVEAALATPVASVGLLHCMQVQLGSGEYWREAYVRSAVPLLLHLLRRIILLHLLLHPKIIALLASALAALGNSKPDVVRQLLDLAVLMLRQGNVVSVLGLVEEWCKSADTSLGRHFVFRLLEVAAPPYEPAFAATVLRLMVATRVSRSRLLDSSVRTVALSSGHSPQSLLEEFAQACAQMQFKPPLPQREAAFLMELTTERARVL